MKEIRSYRIYGLAYPKGGRIFYIGVTGAPLRTRLTEHLAEAKAGRGGTRKRTVILRLLEKGKRPVIVELDRCYPKEWERYERKWIAHYRKLNPRLTNRAAGGLGQHGTHHSAETKRKIAASVSRARSSDRATVLPLSPS